MPLAAFFHRTVLSALFNTILATVLTVIVFVEPFTRSSLHSPRTVNNTVVRINRDVIAAAVDGLSQVVTADDDITCCCGADPDNIRVIQ